MKKNYLSTMKKMSLIILSSNIMLTGCANNLGEVRDTEINRNTANPESMTSSIINNSTSNGQSDSISFESCLKKIWVIKDWDGEAYDYSFSFLITKFENGTIEGNLSTLSIAKPDFYFYNFNSSENSAYFTGEVKDNVAKCTFRDAIGNSGTLIFKFMDNGELEASIIYANKGDGYQDLNLDGKFVFRPYNISDIKESTPLENYSFQTDINSWGDVNIMSFQIHGNKSHPAVFLTNEYGDILYVFDAAFQTASEIKNIEVIDINGDELKDIKIITYFPQDLSIEPIDRIFYQMRNGLFYNSNLEL